MSRIPPDQSKRSLWAKRFSRFRKSGLSVARFCSQENIPAYSFYYWAKRLSGHSQQGEASVVDLTASQLPTSMADALQPASVSIHCHQHLRLTVPAHCIDAIRAILHELLRSDGCISDLSPQATGFQQVIVRPLLQSQHT